MSIDYIVSSLPTLAFDAPAPMSWEAFTALAGDAAAAPAVWTDLETQLRNAVAEARGGGEKFRRPVDGCSIYWKNRVLACFQEKDVAKRDEMLDRVWWDAAGELTAVAAPLGKGALQTYAIRLKIALKRGAISANKGNAAFDQMTSASRISFLVPSS